MARPSFPFDHNRLSSGARQWSLPLFRQMRSFVTKMPPSDKAIAGVLGLCVIVTSLISLGALLRSFQVVVPAHGGTLSEGIIGSPRFDNPLLAISDSDRDLVALTYAGLLGHDANGALVPVLAQSYTVSSDGTTYTFTLRANAKFSDGTPVTADDVVFTVTKAQDPGLRSPLYASWANVRAEAIDARTVRFTLPKAYAPFLEDTTLGILPEHVWRNVGDQEFPFSPYSTSPIAAGPYTVTSVLKDGNGVITGYRLSSFKDFATGEPYLSNIRLTFFTDQVALTKALQNGSVTSAYGVVTGAVHSVPYARVFGVFFNPEKVPAFKDLGVRKALSLAIDRTKLTKNVLGGYATPTMGPLPAGSGVTPIPLPDDATRLSDARKALTDAGYDFDTDSKTWSKDGVALKVTLATSNVPELKAVATQVQTDWQTLGVPVELELHDPSELTQTVIRPRAYGALLFGEVVGTDPDLYAFWAGSERTDPGLNLADYENTDVDTLLTKARAESNASTTQSDLSEAQEKIAADYPAAFLYTPDFLYTVPPSIKGISLTRVSAPSDRFWDVSHWYRYSEHVWPIFLR